MMKSLGYIFNIKKLNKQNFVISNVIEKPNTKEAPSNNAVIGRYILSKNIFKILKAKQKERVGDTYYRLN